MHSLETFRDLKREAREWRHYLHENPELDSSTHAATFATEK